MKRERPGMMHLKKVTNTADYDSYGLPGAARPRPQLAAAGRRRPGRSPSRRPPTGVCGAPAPAPGRESHNAQLGLGRPWRERPEGRPGAAAAQAPAGSSPGPSGEAAGRRGGSGPAPRRPGLPPSLRALGPGAGAGTTARPAGGGPAPPGRALRGRGPRGAARRRLRAAGLASPAAVTCPGRLPRSGALDGAAGGGPRAPWGVGMAQRPLPDDQPASPDRGPGTRGRRDLESSRKADLQGWQRASPPGRPPTSRPACGAGSKAALNRARGTLSPAATHTDTHTKTSAGFLLTLPQRESSGSSELNPVVLTPN